MREHARWPPLVAPDGSLVVELHYRLGAVGTPLGFDVAGVWNRAVGCERDRALLPAPEDLVVHVALHWLLDRRLRSEGALGQLADLTGLLLGAGDAIDWDVVVTGARRDHFGRPLAAALRVAEELFLVTLPSGAALALAPDGLENGLVADLIRRRVFRAEPWAALERLGPRTTPLRQLLPPRPRRVLARVGEGQSWLDGLLLPYASWAAGAARVIVGMRDVRAEVRFDRSYRALVASDSEAA
jgi:hypothetical protein